MGARRGAQVEEFRKAAQFRQAPYYTTQNVLVMMGQRDGYHDASVWFGNIDKLLSSVSLSSSLISPWCLVVSLLLTDSVRNAF
jgi:hypothetical protein